MSRLPRLVAYPESAAVLKRHVAASVLLSARRAALQMVPFLLKAFFEAPNHYAVLASMAGQVMSLGPS